MNGAFLRWGSSLSRRGPATPVKYVRALTNLSFWLTTLSSWRSASCFCALLTRGWGRLKESRLPIALGSPAKLFAFAMSIAPPVLSYICSHIDGFRNLHVQFISMVKKIEFLANFQFLESIYLGEHRPNNSYKARTSKFRVKACL